MLHCSQDASTGWTRKSWYGSIATRSCASPWQWAGRAGDEPVRSTPASGGLRSRHRQRGRATGSRRAAPSAVERLLAGPSSSSSSITTTRNPSAAAVPMLSPAPRPTPRIRSSRSSGCLIWLTCARRARTFRSSVADVSTQVSACVRPEEVDPAHACGREARPREVRERHRVAGRRVDRVDGGDPGGPMVGVVDAAAP